MALMGRVPETGARGLKLGGFLQRSSLSGPRPGSASGLLRLAVPGFGSGFGRALALLGGLDALAQGLHEVLDLRLRGTALGQHDLLALRLVPDQLQHTLAVLVVVALRIPFGSERSDELLGHLELAFAGLAADRHVLHL